MISLVSLTFASIFLYMTLWYLIALVLKRNDIADIAWGLGFIFVCVVHLYFGVTNSIFLLVATLTTLWGFRLALHIYSRNKGKSEDFRYKKWREDWGEWFYVRSYLQVFLLQGFFMFLISFSALIAAHSGKDQSLNIISYTGVFVWLIGFVFETFGDYQLSKFISNKNNKGKIMTKGVWRYSRHPNYFGEVTQWWGLFLVVVTLPKGILAIISPLTITFLILKVSGIPMLEKKYEGNANFEEYKKVTNAFFPWFPKKTA